MTLPIVTEATIRQYASAEAFARGEDYVRQGAVGALVRREQVLQAEVEGSGVIPYRVQITFDSAGVIEARCTCPYKGGDWCKHIVAVLLSAIRAADGIQVRQSLEKLLAGRDSDQLLTLIVALADDDPALADRIESLVAGSTRDVTMASTGPVPRRTPVDTEAVRKSVRATIRGAARAQYSGASWGRVSIVGEMATILAQARSFVEVDDGYAALAVLEALTDEYADAWFEVDDSNGEGGYFFFHLDPVWTEAFLSVDLTDDERDEWIEKLDNWQAKVDDYGIGPVFKATQLAVTHGLAALPVQRLPPVDPADPYAWAGYRTEEQRELLSAALNVLDRRGRHDDYLRLSDAAGLVMRHATMLVRLGRTEEAVAYSLANLGRPHEALVVAKALREAGDLPGALAVADCGLALGGELAALATWTRDVAAGSGDYPRALAAALLAFRSQPTLIAYQRAEELADDAWPTHRADLLTWLRTQKTYAPQGQVDVFLSEGLIDDAINAVTGSYADDIVAQVVDAAVTTRPDWAIATARRQAEAIMNAGKANHYDEAAQWLARVRDAYQLSDRFAEWTAYRDSLLALHGRKYKLVPLIKALR